MKILLDTHIFLWFISRDQRLTADMKEIIQEESSKPCEHHHHHSHHSHHSHHFKIHTLYMAPRDLT